MHLGCRGIFGEMGVSLGGSSVIPSPIAQGHWVLLPTTAQASIPLLSDTNNLTVLQGTGAPRSSTTVGLLQDHDTATDTSRTEYGHRPSPDTPPSLSLPLATSPRFSSSGPHVSRHAPKDGIRRSFCTRAPRHVAPCDTSCVLRSLGRFGS